MILIPDAPIADDDLGMLSHDGRCYSFDDRANGIGRGEGIGVLVVKPLMDAVQHGDAVRAVIRSAACNHDGATPQLGQPNGKAMRSLIEDTYFRAGLDLSATRYFEANGQGMALDLRSESVYSDKQERLPVTPLRPMQLTLSFVDTDQQETRYICKPFPCPRDCC